MNGINALYFYIYDTMSWKKIIQLFCEAFLILLRILGISFSRRHILRQGSFYCRNEVVPFFEIFSLSVLDSFKTLL